MPSRGRRVRGRARVGARVRTCLREVAADASVDFEEGGSTVGPHLVVDVRVRARVRVRAQGSGSGLDSGLDSG